MRKYELMFILKTNIEEEARNAVIERVKGIIEADGEIEKVDEWGNRKLAYEIEKMTEGYYVVITFKAQKDVPKEVERVLGISDQVMRHLVVNLEEK